jgi:hypothetical protein
LSTPGRPFRSTRIRPPGFCRGARCIDDTARVYLRQDAAQSHLKPRESVVARILAPVSFPMVIASRKDLPAGHWRILSAPYAPPASESVPRYGNRRGDFSRFSWRPTAEAVTTSENARVRLLGFGNAQSFERPLPLFVNSWEGTVPDTSGIFFTPTSPDAIALLAAAMHWHDWTFYVIMKRWLREQREPLTHD